jgi:hypothetical protein
MRHQRNACGDEADSQWVEADSSSLREEIMDAT